MMYDNNRKYALDKALDMCWPASQDEQPNADNVLKTAEKFLRFIEGGEKGKDTEKA